MATFIERIDDPITFNSANRDKTITPFAYINEEPLKVLSELIFDFHIEKYLGIYIPRIEEIAKKNLRISFIPSAEGLNGTIDMLKKMDLINDYRHETYSKGQLQSIAETIKSNLKPCFRNQEPLHKREAEIYSSILRVLGCDMSVEELYKLTTHEDYYKPILLSEIIGSNG